MPGSEPSASVTEVKLGHLGFRTASQPAMAGQILQWLTSEEHSGKTITYVNPHVFNLSAEHPEVQRWIEQADLVCVDGVGIKLALRFLCRTRVNRVVAEELFREILLTPGQAVTAVLAGVEKHEVTQAAAAINHGGFAIGVVDGIDGFSTDEAYAAFFKRHPDVDLVLIGAGTPRSEHIGLIAAQYCSAAVCWHIGAGTIKTWAGTKRRAPVWISQSGLQWLHRIVFEPHTRARYLGGFFKFVQNIFTTNKQDHDGA